MASLAKQLTILAAQLEKLRDSIPVADDVAAVTIEQHSPGNGSTYTRLRAPKGEKLPNGNRTMTLDTEQQAIWTQKIYARNQQAKAIQCLALIEQAAAIAEQISWDDMSGLVNKEEEFTIDQTTFVSPGVAVSPPASKPDLITVSYVKTKQGTLTHAVAEAPIPGRWHTPALCGATPPQKTYGWDFPDTGELTCDKCWRKLPRDHGRYPPEVIEN